MSDLEPFPDGWQRATVIVAHPDDIEWGVAGGRRGVDGGRPHGVVRARDVRRGRASTRWTRAAAKVARQAEERASGAIVGVDEIEFLGHPDGRIVEGLDLRRDLAAAIRRHRPDVVVAQNHAERWGSEPGRRVEQRRPPRRRAGDARRRVRRRQPLDLPRAGRASRGRACSGSPSPHAPATTHAVDVSGVVDQAVASLAAHEQYLRAHRRRGPRWRSPPTCSAARPSDVAERFGGRRRRGLRADPRPGGAVTVATRRRVSSGSPFEATVGYCRAVRRRRSHLRVRARRRCGPTARSPTTPASRPGAASRSSPPHSPSWAAGCDDVVRVRVYLVDAGRLREPSPPCTASCSRTMRPTNTTVVVAALLDPRWKVEIEVDAVALRRRLGEVVDDLGAGHRQQHRRRADDLGRPAAAADDDALGAAITRASIHSGSPAGRANGVTPPMAMPVSSAVTSAGGERRLARRRGACARPG